MRFNLIELLDSGQDLQQLIIGEEIEPLEDISLLLQKVLQSFLHYIKSFIIGFKNF